MDFFEENKEEGIKRVPIIFIHGWLDSWKSWTLILQDFKLNVRKIAISLRGWGDSEKVGPYTIESYANDIIDFLKEKDIEECILCGHSMGTLISTLIAAKQPNLVKGLILCGAAAKMNPEHILDPSTSLTLKGLNDVISNTFPDGPISTEGLNLLDSFQCDDLRPLVQNGLIPEEFMNQVMQETLKATPRSYREAFQHMIDEDHTSHLSNISCPTLVIWGTNDALFDRLEQNKLQSLFRNSRRFEFQEINQAPHGLIWTHSSVCADLVQRWYQEIIMIEEISQHAS